jgi:glucose/arabinose transport system permease protein
MRSLTASLIIIIIGILWAIPLYVLIIGSFKNISEVLTTPIFLPSERPDFYTLLKTGSSMTDPLINTIIEVIPAAFISTILGSLSAYAFHRFTSKIKDIILIIIAIATYIPYQSIMVPLAIFIRSLGLYDTVWGVLIAFIILYIPIASLLMTIFMSSVPRDLIHAAEVDGASEFTIFRRVVLPILGPGFTSTVVFLVIQAWNNFFVPLILVRGYEKHVTLKVFSYIGQSGNLYNEMFSAALIASLPPLIIFISMGRYFIRGLLTLGMGGR